MGKSTVAVFVILGVLSVALAQETMTTVEKTPETTTEGPTRLPPHPSTLAPDLIHNVNETVKNATAEAEKNIQKGSAGATIVNYGLIFAVAAACVTL